MSQTFWRAQALVASLLPGCSPMNYRIRKEDERRQDNDIYVYFKEKDGTWTKPINLGSTVNTNFNETCPSITPDGKYLFFGRYNEEGGLSNFYWVSAEVINKVRPVDIKE